MCGKFKDTRLNATYIIWLTEEYTVHEHPILLESEFEKKDKKLPLSIVSCLES